jgi:DNA topoisomerase VI subunit A
LTKKAAAAAEASHKTQNQELKTITKTKSKTKNTMIASCLSREFSLAATATSEDLYYNDKDTVTFRMKCKLHQGPMP